jgi:hypothetical protein
VVSATNTANDETSRNVDVFGLEPGQVVQEHGWDEDTDEALRSAIEAATGTELVDEDYDDVADAALVWWRSDDGDVTDLTDQLVDAQTLLDDGARVWLLTPKPGRPGHVLPSDIAEAATTAGLHATSSLSVAPDWSATKLDTRSRGR